MTGVAMEEGSNVPSHSETQTHTGANTGLRSGIILSEPRRILKCISLKRICTFDFITSIKVTNESRFVI